MLVEREMNNNEMYVFVRYSVVVPYIRWPLSFLYLASAAVTKEEPASREKSENSKKSPIFFVIL
jgi:hypothetical protein